MSDHTETVSEFTVEYELDDVSDSTFLGHSLGVRTRVRIYVGDVCITDKRERFRHSDYLPGNLTKMLRVAGTIVRDEDFLVRFSDTICDIHFRPDDGRVFVNACTRDGTPFNPDVPKRGVPADPETVVSEILGEGRKLRIQYEQIDGYREDEGVESFLRGLDRAEAIADEYFF